MLPHYSYYIKSHHRMMFKPILIASTILTVCFINNFDSISFKEIIIGNFTIFFVILLSAMNNERIYLIYCVFSEKFMLNDFNQRISKDKNKEPIRFYIVFIFYIIIVLSFFYFVIYSFLNLYENNNYITILLGIILSPILIWLFMKWVIHYYLYESIEFSNHYSFNGQLKNKWKLSSIIIREIILSLIVNIAIVFPISRKSTFSLHNGYLDLDLIIALTILLYSILAVMFFFSKGSKINYLMGAILFYRVSDTIRIVKQRSVINRLLTFIFIVPISVVFICVLFFLFNFKEDFYLIYPVSLIPIIWIYYQERKERLSQDFILAFDMVLRLNAIKSL